MTGLEKITDEIRGEAKAQAQERTDDAKKQAEAILAQARQDAEKTSADIAQKAENTKKTKLERAASSADMQTRQVLLGARQEMIQEVLQRAYDKILHLDDDAYFAFLYRLLDQSVLDRDGILYLSEKDKARMPSDFPEKAAQAAQKKGGTLKVSDETRKLDGGFVLSYGGIEENCSIEAILRARRDELSDLVGKVLFS